MLLQNGVIIGVYPDSGAPEQNGGLPPDIVVSHPPAAEHRLRRESGN